MFRQEGCSVFLLRPPMVEGNVREASSSQAGLVRAGFTEQCAPPPLAKGQVGSAQSQLAADALAAGSDLA
jgi:hypothetical protein